MLMIMPASMASKPVRSMESHSSRMAASWISVGQLGNDALDAGKAAVDGGDGVGEGYSDVFTHGLEKMREAE